MKDPTRNTQHATRNTQHAKIITFLLISSFLILISFSFQSCQEATAPNFNELNDNNTTLAKEQLRLLNDESIISSNFANILTNNNVKDFLVNSVKNANTKENILDAKRFFTETISTPGLNNSSLLEIMLSKANKNQKQQLTNIFDRLSKGKVDVYFPIKGHFEKWLKNKNNLLIGYSIPEREWEPVIVYDLKGNSYQISGKEIPETPVLMVIGCEHHGNHKLPSKSPSTYQQGSGGDEGGGGYGGGGVPNHNRIDGNPDILSTVKLFDDCESWFLGDPEIYYVIAASIYGEIERIWLDNVNNEDVTYTLNQDMFNWHWTYGDAYKMKFAEDDDGTYSVGATAAGFGFNITISNGDDDMGMKIINKEDVYNKSYNTGKVLFYIKYYD